jgi:hypothetical protein
MGTCDDDLRKLEGDGAAALPVADGLFEVRLGVRFSPVGVNSRGRLSVPA